MHPNIEQLITLVDVENTDNDSLFTSHVKTCALCQARIAELRQVMTHARSVTRESKAPIHGDHVSDDELVAYVDKSLAAEHEARVRTHLRHCGPCMKETLLYRSHRVERNLRAQAATSTPPAPQRKSNWIDWFTGARLSFSQRTWASASIVAVVAIFALRILPEMETAAVTPVALPVLSTTQEIPPATAIEAPVAAATAMLVHPETLVLTNNESQAATLHSSPTSAPLQAINGAEGVAVIIGNQNYAVTGLPEARFAIRDALAVKELLTKSLGFDESNIIYVENATTARFNEVFGTADNFTGRLQAAVKPGVSDVFIYYSGHGTPDLVTQRAYFLPVDADPNFIALSGYALDTLYKNIERLAARSVTLTLDASFSGQSANGWLLRNVSPASVPVSQALPALTNTIFFASSNFAQTSTTYPEHQHGLFTYFFLQGLRGAADGNSDGAVASSELNSYLQKHVPYTALRQGGKKQVPLFAQTQDRVLYRDK